MSFRNRPPAIDSSNLVLREALVSKLSQRYEARVVMVTGGPGFGKTTLLSQAIVQNRLVPAGLDVWVACYSGDGDAHTLATAIFEGLDVTPEWGRTEPARAVADAVWSRAPVEVALILDDFHLVPADSDGHQLVADLGRILPENGHLVISARTRSSVALGRYRAAGDLIEIGEADLAFSDREQRQFAAIHDLDPTSDLGWPALAQLTAVAGTGSAIEYLWEEVLGSISPQRRRAIAEVSHFDEIEDSLVQRVTGLEIGAAALLDGLPLVSMSEDGRRRLHDLWRTALERELEPDDRSAALSRGGMWLLENNRLFAAASAFARAENTDGLRTTATAAVFRPLTRTDVDDARQIHALLPTSLRAGSVGAVLSAFALLGSHEMKAIEGFEIAAQLARADGDTEIEARSIWLATQLHGLMHGLPAALHLQGRTAELAETGLASAVAMRSRHQAYELLMAGDPEGALSATAKFDGFGERIATMLCEQIHMDIGRPELVGAAGVPADIEEQTRSRELDLNFALALWLRGDLDPELALPLGIDLVEVIESQRMPHQSLLSLAIVTGVAVAAGEIAVAADHVERLAALDTRRFGRFASGYGDIAQAALECTLGDESAAAARLTDLVAELEIGFWIPRTYLHVIGTIYLLVPSTRDAVDKMEFGAVISDLVEVARTLIMVRQGGSCDSALEAPWHEPNRLRSGFWPPHIVELAVAAISTGDAPPSVERVLQTIPDFGRHLRALGGHSNSAIADEAQRLIAELSTAAPHELSVCALGPLSLRIDGEPVDDDLWTRRERVRRLFGYLIEHKTIARRRAAAEMWPDLEISKALVNLRVNLSYLQKVLEPHRTEGVAPWFISADDEQLVLHVTRVDVDAWHFDELTKSARRALDRSVPSEALDLFAKAVAIYDGDYLEAWEDEYWGAFERLRYRSQLVQAANRAGELLLARGEPERAMDFARTALRFEPLSEPAHRIQIRAMLGWGDRAGARRAADALLTLLDDASMRPEPDTKMLLERLGL